MKFWMPLLQITHFHQEYYNIILSLPILSCMYLSLPLPPSSWSQCDANPDATKLVVQEDKYENVLTLIVYYQMVSLSGLRHSN